MRRGKRWIANRLWEAERHGDHARGANERGSATLEFITVGLILLVPLVYLVLTMATIQGAAFAVEGGARQAVRVYVQSANETEAAERAERAIRFALADAGLHDVEPVMSISCAPKPNACLTRLGTVTITVSLTVALPLAPSFLNIDQALGVPLQAASTQRVSRFWGAG